MIGEQLGHFRRRDADEPDLHAAGAHPVGPRGLVLVIDQRRQHERDVAIDHFATRPTDVVAGAGEDRRDVGHVDAGDVVELLLEIRHHGRDARERIEPRSVSADHRVLADKPSIRLQVRENDLHQSPQSDISDPDRKTAAQAVNGGPRGDFGENVRVRGCQSSGPTRSSSGCSVGVARTSASMLAAGASFWIAARSSSVLARAAR